MLPVLKTVKRLEVYFYQDSQEQIVLWLEKENMFNR
ncbi:hypothetical protein THOM_2321 [Trachipleistophora hominis]|uniref:Uncharacterized protein n=1 Tax=Trachipleistophora hominis TaxID=72359 RepID=L7JTY1_TRAHO|nr:hypothetical protein THOM_2321 [Trachipleistophora hominis]